MRKNLMKNILYKKNFNSLIKYKKLRQKNIINSFFKNIALFNFQF